MKGDMHKGDKLKDNVKQLSDLKKENKLLTWNQHFKV